MLPTSVPTWFGAQLAPSVSSRRLEPLTLGTSRLMGAVTMKISSDVARAADDTYALVEKVARMTSILERETDTALLAIAGWGAHIPSRFRPPHAI